MLAAFCQTQTLRPLNRHLGGRFPRSPCNSTVDSMNDDLSPNPDQNPYHPYEETKRYRAFRDGWAAQRHQRPRTANPFPLARIGCALAWLDGWTAAVDGGPETIGRRQQWAAHQVDRLDFIYEHEDSPVGAGA